MSRCVEYKLSNGHTCLIDGEDEGLISGMNWYAYFDGNNWYARSNPEKISMHRFILNMKKNPLSVDHLNGDGLDNRKSNLRKVTHSQNMNNKKNYKNNKSGESGISYEGRKKSHRWHVRISRNCKKYNLGYYDSFELAKEAKYKLLTELKNTGETHV